MPDLPSLRRLIFDIVFPFPEDSYLNLHLNEVPILYDKPDAERPARPSDSERQDEMQSTL